MESMCVQVRDSILKNIRTIETFSPTHRVSTFFYHSSRFDHMDSSGGQIGDKRARFFLKKIKWLEWWLKRSSVSAQGLVIHTRIHAHLFLIFFIRSSIECGGGSIGSIAEYNIEGEVRAARARGASETTKMGDGLRKYIDIKLVMKNYRSPLIGVFAYMYICARIGHQQQNKQNM